MIRRAFGFIVRRGFRLSLFAAALACGGLLANGVISNPVNGSGKSVTVDRPIGNVTEVVISGGSNVKIVRGDVPSVRVTADDNILPLLETKTSNGKLTFETKSGFSIHPVTPIVYTVTIQRLEKLAVSGAGNVQAVGLAGDSLTIKLSGAGNATLKDIACKTLNLNMSGAGNAMLTGTVEKVEVRLSGAGDIDAVGLKVAAADTRISGAGTAKMWVTDELKVKVSGAGSIQYKGSPRIEQKISGAGSVKPLGG
jgi:hypothetical protein